jgi:TonB family protein
MRISNLLKVLVIVMLSVILTTIICCKKNSLFNNSNKFPVADSSSNQVNYSDSSMDYGKVKLTEYDTPPIPEKNPMPTYPYNYRKSGIQGVVVLEVEVTEYGSVGEVKVMKSLLSEEGSLDEAAVNAVKDWKFKPALLKNKPVKSRVNIPIPFTLKQGT